MAWRLDESSAGKQRGTGGATRVIPTRKIQDTNVPQRCGHGVQTRAVCSRRHSRRVVAVPSAADAPPPSRRGRQRPMTHWRTYGRAHVAEQVEARPWRVQDARRGGTRGLLWCTPSAAGPTWRCKSQLLTTNRRRQPGGGSGWWRAVTRVAVGPRGRGASPGRGQPHATHESMQCRDAMRGGGPRGGASRDPAKKPVAAAESRKWWQRGGLGGWGTDMERVPAKHRRVIVGAGRGSKITLRTAPAPWGGGCATTAGRYGTVHPMITHTTSAKTSGERGRW